MRVSLLLLRLALALALTHIHVHMMRDVLEEGFGVLVNRGERSTSWCAHVALTFEPGRPLRHSNGLVALICEWEMVPCGIVGGRWTGDLS